MSEFQQMARRLAPVLLSITDGPYLVSVCRAPTGPEEPPAEATVDFCFGAGLDEWYPSDDCIAIFAVVPGGATGEHAAPLLQRAKRPGRPGGLVYGGSRQGEQFAAMSTSVGGPVVELELFGGRHLNAIRSKFGLPPGPPSLYDLEMSSTFGDRPAGGQL